MCCLQYSLFAWLISCTFSANEQYFSLTTNQPTIFLAMTYQPSEQGNYQEKRPWKGGRGISISFSLAAYIGR